MLRYFKNEEETKAVIDGEWYFTGDLGYYDEDGYFYIVDRLKQMIKNPANYQVREICHLFQWVIIFRFVIDRKFDFYNLIL